VLRRLSNAPQLQDKGQRALGFESQWPHARKTTAGLHEARKLLATKAQGVLLTGFSSGQHQ
jgi:hypothetical protein